MLIPIQDAERRLADLIRQAELGESVVLTRDGQEVARLVASSHATACNGVDVARLVASSHAPMREERMEVVRRLQASAARTMTPGPDAARSQDFLYDEDGLPA